MNEFSPIGQVSGTLTSGGRPGPGAAAPRHLVTEHAVVRLAQHRRRVEARARRRASLGRRGSSPAPRSAARTGTARRSAGSGALAERLLGDQRRHRRPRRPRACRVPARARRGPRRCRPAAAPAASPRPGEVAVGELGVGRATPHAQRLVEQAGPPRPAGGPRPARAAPRSRRRRGSPAPRRAGSPPARCRAGPARRRSAGGTPRCAVRHVASAGGAGPQAASMSASRGHRPAGVHEQRGQHGAPAPAGQPNARAVATELQRAEHTESRPLARPPVHSLARHRAEAQ